MCFGVITLNLNLNQDQWHGHRWLSPPAASRAACPSSTALPARPATHHDPSRPTPIAGAPSWTSGMVTKGMTTTAMILQQWLVSETNSFNCCQFVIQVLIYHQFKWLPSHSPHAWPVCLTSNLGDMQYLARRNVINFDNSSWCWYIFPRRGRITLGSKGTSASSRGGSIHYCKAGWSKHS